MEDSFSKITAVFPLSLLSEGLQFAIPPTEIEYTDFMLPFELLYRDIKLEEVPSENLNISKNKLLDLPLPPPRKLKVVELNQILVAMSLEPQEI